MNRLPALLFALGLVLSASACVRQLHGVDASKGGVEVLAKRLVGYYQAEDFESIPTLSPSLKDIKAVQKEWGTPEGATKMKFQNPRSQSVLEDTVVAIVRRNLAAGAVNPRELVFERLDTAQVAVDSGIPLQYSAYSLYMRGPKGIYQQPISVLNIKGRNYLANTGPLQPVKQ